MVVAVVAAVVVVVVVCDATGLNSGRALVRERGMRADPLTPEAVAD